jgi:hypothetical protein
MSGYLKSDSIRIFVCISILLLISIQAWNQTNENRVYAYRTTQDTIQKINTAGDELQIAMRHYYWGTGLSLAGAGLIAGSYFIPEWMSRDGSFNIFMVGLGSVFAISGAILNIESYSHIGKAGIVLNEYGVGIKVPIK